MLCPNCRKPMNLKDIRKVRREKTVVYNYCCDDCGVSVSVSAKYTEKTV